MPEWSPKWSPTSGHGNGQRSRRLLKFECGRPHRHPIVVRSDPQQFELCFPVMEGLGYPSAFFGAGAIPATERNITSYSHGLRLLHYVFLHIV